jgi:hypothetical protein
MLGCDVPGFFVSTIADDRLVFAIQIVGLFNDLRFSSFLTTRNLSSFTWACRCLRVCPISVSHCGQFCTL